MMTAGFENPMILSVGVIKPVSSNIPRTVNAVTSIGKNSVKKSTKARRITNKTIAISIVIF